MLCWYCFLVCKAQWVRSTQLSDTSKRWWTIVNNPVSNFSRQFSEKAVLWWRKGTGCYGIRLWLLGCGKQRALGFRRMHACKQEALQGTAESLGSVQDRGRNLLKQVVVASMESSRHRVFGFPESTSFSLVTDSQPIRPAYALLLSNHWERAELWNPEDFGSILKVNTCSLKTFHFGKHLS